MPIYEYSCLSCGHRLETMQKLSDPPLRDCPSCGRPDLNKLVSAAGFRLKGGGWYETDFKSGKEKKRNVLGSGSESGGGEGKSGTDAKASAPEKTPKPGGEKASGSTS